MNDSALKNSVKIEGIETLEKSVDEIRSHKKTFVVAALNSIFPVGLEVIYSGGIDTSANVRMTPSLEQLKEIFKECKDIIQKDKGYFVIYDFGYYTKDNNFRNLIIMLSFIPDTLNIKDKMAYSSSIAYILHSIVVNHHIPLHEMEELDFDKICDKCMFIRK